MYDPVIGRFLQRDPFAGQIGAPITLHRFIYANNNPVNLVDPSGFGVENSQQVLDPGVRCDDQTNVLRHFSCGDAVLVTNTGQLVPLDPVQRDTLANAVAAMGIDPDDVRYASGGSGPTASGGQRRLPFTDPDRVSAINRTLDRIESGGPFPYSQDGTVFRNAEGLLPAKPLGYYREYTVDTPGATNRGARRIVQGQGGETYYTDDHYRSFIQIDPRRY